MRKRKATFKNVPVHIDGRKTATVAIEPSGSLGDYFFVVRVAFGRRDYRLPLGTVAEIVAYKVTKQEIEEERRAGK